MNLFHSLHYWPSAVDFCIVLVGFKIAKMPQRRKEYSLSRTAFKASHKSAT